MIVDNFLRDDTIQLATVSVEDIEAEVDAGTYEDDAEGAVSAGLRSSELTEYGVGFDEVIPSEV